MNSPKKYGFLVLGLGHSGIALAMYLLGGAKLIPSYGLAAMLTSILTQPFLKYAFYSYWRSISLAQKLVIFLLPSILAFSSRELSSGLFIYSISAYWFYSFYAKNSEKRAAA